MKSNFLVTVEDEYPIFNPVARNIKEFLRIITRDKGSVGDAQGRKKLMALKELAFIALFSDLTSSYRIRNEDEDERTDELKKTLELPDDWVIDDVMRDAIKVYEDANQTPSSGLLEAVRKAVNSSRKMIAIVERRLQERVARLEGEVLDDKERNALIDTIFADIDKVVNISDKIGDQLEKLDKLEEKYVKELEMMSGKNKSAVSTWQLPRN